MVRARLGEADARDGFLLDGYPRTLDQVEALDRILSDAGQDLDAVLLLEVDIEEVVQRLVARGADSGRSDDNEETIRRRLQVYTEQTGPLVDVYRGRGLLRAVNGMPPVEEVTSALLEALGAR
jgi:adenylate kinase